MRINSAGSVDTNLLQSDQFTFRNEDYVVDQGGAFTRGGNQGAGGLTYAMMGLHNPTGSGVTVILDKIIIMVDIQANVFVERVAGTFGTLAGSWYNMDIFGADGNAQVYGHFSSTAIGVLMNQYLLNAGENMQIDYKYPFFIPENRGIYVSTINTNIKVNFYGREV